MIRHGRALPITQPYREVDHMAVLQKMIYRLSDDLTPEVRTRLESVIGTYQRLYAR